MEREVAEKRTIVLKPQLSKEEVEEIIEKKKTSLFGTVFTRPKPDDIKVTSIELFYEPFWVAGGRYIGNYYRKNVYEVKTDSVVKEVKIGEGVFPVQNKSGGWSKFKVGVTGSQNNQLEIPVEEHVEIDIEDEIAFNPQGNETELNYKIESKHQENFPEKILQEKKDHVRGCLLNQEQVLEKLEEILKEDVEDDIKMVKEKISIDKLDEVFVPIYEARCVDPKSKVEILRVDAINKKIIGTK